jgi:hypothetical protein
VAITVVLIFLSVLLLIHGNSTSVEIPDWIKDNAEKLIENGFNEFHIIPIIKNLSNEGIIKNTIHNESQMYSVPNKGKITFVNLSGNINEYGKTGFVSLEISTPDGSKEILRTPVLETGYYSTVFLINDQFQKGTYRVLAEFNGKQTSLTYFYLTDDHKISERIPSWFVTIFNWWVENKISDEEFIYCTQYLVDNKILIIIENYHNISELDVSVDGQHFVRRGTTHTITSHVTYGDHYVEGARVTLTIEDYDENIIREFNGFTNERGDFVFSWEVPKKFDDIENLLVYVSVTHANSSMTKLFRFQVYCLSGESNCKVEGN